jgi:outer membrane lipoprotein SlyB
MRLVTVFLFASTSAGLAACAAHPQPIIDMKGVDQKQFTQDWNECAAYSKEVNVAQGAAKGAATGAAVGAVAGAIGGDVGDSAAYGGLYGGTLSALGADREQQMVFKRCMRGRGYRVLN